MATWPVTDMHDWIFKLLTVALILMSPAYIARANSIDTMIDVKLSLTNAFKGFPIPTRETLLANSPGWSSVMRRRRLYGAKPTDCGTELIHVGWGFERIYPNAPDYRENVSSWVVHVEMSHFPHLVLCRLRNTIKRNLREIETNSLPVTPVVQSVDVTTYDFTAYFRLPKPVQHLHHAADNLIWMSYRGFSPAMLELLKLADRTPVVRLTKRFKYYLLKCATLADIEDPLIDELLPKITRMVTDTEIEELNAWAKAKSWPRTERMVID